MNNIKLNISFSTQETLIKLVKDQITRENEDIKKWEKRISFTQSERGIELAQTIIDSHKNSIRELKQNLQELTASVKVTKYYDVYFTSKSWESQFVCSWEGDLSKDELSSMVEEKTKEKPNLVIREIFKEEYDLMIKEEYRTFNDL